MTKMQTRRKSKIYVYTETDRIVDKPRVACHVCTLTNTYTYACATCDRYAVTAENYAIHLNVTWRCLLLQWNFTRMGTSDNKLIAKCQRGRTWIFAYLLFGNLCFVIQRICREYIYSDEKSNENKLPECTRWHGAACHTCLRLNGSKRWIGLWIRDAREKCNGRT